MKVLTELFLSFLKMGFFSIGGGYSMLPFIEDEVVRHGWMDIEELVNFLAVSESTPGSMSVNMACFVGLKTAKLPGLLAATLGVSLPSFGVMLLIAVFYRQFKVNKAVLSVLKGLQPTVTGLIASAIITVGISVFFPDRRRTRLRLSGRAFQHCTRFHPVGLQSVQAGRPRDRDHRRRKDHRLH